MSLTTIPSRNGNGSAPAGAIEPLPIPPLRLAEKRRPPTLASMSDRLTAVWIALDDAAAKVADIVEVADELDRRVIEKRRRDRASTRRVRARRNTQPAAQRLREE